jgi:hypothetical protein
MACPTGEYEETLSGNCRYEYSGVHSWGNVKQNVALFKVDRHDNSIFKQQSLRLIINDDHKLFYVASHLPPANGLVEIQTSVKVKSVMQDDYEDFYKMPLVLATDGQVYKVDVFEARLIGPLSFMNSDTRMKDDSILITHATYRYFVHNSTLYYYYFGHSDEIEFYTVGVEPVENILKMANVAYDGPGAIIKTNGDLFTWNRCKF